ncbi:hypothetical protein FCS83_01355 [Oenococcus sp. UCMA 17063]|nr:hypothetical protein [Oenococcus sp. UCMA 17063]
MADKDLKSLVEELHTTNKILKKILDGQQTITKELKSVVSNKTTRIASKDSDNSENQKEAQSKKDSKK